MNLKRHWLILAAMAITSLSIPLIAGSYWLWMHHWLFWWVAGSAALAMTVWLANRLLRGRHSEPKWLELTDNIMPTRRNEEAWKKVERISANARDSDPDLGNSSFYLQTLTQVMSAVAEVYHPQNKQAVLEIKVPYLLKVIEIFAQELRLNFSEHVPGSHMFSVNDFAKGHKIATKGLELYRLFRIVTAGIDPVTAMIRELRVFAFANLLSDSTDDLKRWLIDAYVKKIGYYAIELYSGNMTLDDDAFDRPTQQTQRELETLVQKNEATHSESFRLLIVGQSNAGKASLINAIAERHLANVEATPAQNHRMTYLLHRDDLPATMIVDSRRYHDNPSETDTRSLLKQAAKSDVVVMVLSATNAARQIDYEVWQRLRQLPNAPQLLLVLSHIDRLRPIREWTPPYDLTSQSQKAIAIRDAVNDTAAQFNIDPSGVMPLCLKASQIYNCRELLIPVIERHMKHSQAKVVLQHQATQRVISKRRRLWRQIFNASVLVSKVGVNWYLKKRLAIGA